MLRSRLEIDAFALFEMVFCIANVRFDFTFQDEDKLLTGVGDRVWFHLAFAPVDKDGLHLFIEKLGSDRIDGVAFVGGNKGLRATCQIGSDRRLPIFPVLHQSRYTHAQRIGDLRERRQRGDRLSGLDLRKQALGALTGARHFLQGSPLLRADAANTDANIQDANSVTSSRDAKALRRTRSRQP